MVALACTKLSITSRFANVQVITMEFTAKNSVSKTSKFLFERHDYLSDRRKESKNKRKDYI